MKKKSELSREERRREQVEMNLLDGQENMSSGLGKSRRGCALPFGSLLLIVLLIQLGSPHLP